MHPITPRSKIVSNSKIQAAIVGKGSQPAALTIFIGTA